METNIFTCSLSDRMKLYEGSFGHTIDHSMPIIVRVDGKNFSRITKRLGVIRPFDERLSFCMKYAMERVCDETRAILVAETHSDEASFLLKGFERDESQPYFGGKVQKISSVIASMFSVWFNLQAIQEFLPREPAYFDGRTFSLPTGIEATNYFLSRSRDCFRNSINDLARSQFSHKTLQGKNTDEKINMIQSDSLTLAMTNHDRMYGSFIVRDEWIDKTDREKPTFASLGEMLQLIENNEESVL